MDVLRAAQEWCARRGVQKSMRVNYATYGAEGCGILARAWCHKMQHFYNLELTDPAGPALAFHSGLVDAYVEPTEFTRLADGAAGALSVRVGLIRGLFRGA